jgi:hypothetical protein
MIRSLTVCCALAVSLVLVGHESCGARQNCDISALELQMRLFAAIASSNPNYDDTLAVVVKLDRLQQEERLAALAEQNARDPQIAALIDSLMATGAYKLYFRQFKNVTPDVHRRVFSALPYRGIPSPGDIGQVQFELFGYRDSLVALVSKISQVDMAEAVSISRQWAPPGELSIPTTYYLMDGNADAFAREDGVCFDLYGVILGKRPESYRYENLAEIPVNEIEAVLAHEYQHIFAQAHLYPATRKFDNWQDLWEDVIIRRIVSEGVAMQCNPPKGFKKAIYEDTTVVSFWLRELERVIGQVRRNETTEDSVRAWLDWTYHEPARQLLADYLKRTYSDGDQNVLLRDHVTYRPSGIYTLGWWMVSHIASAPGGHDQAVQLLDTPHQLFYLYNATVADTLFKIGL